MKKRREYFGSHAEEWDKNFTAEELEILSHLINSIEIKSGSRIVDLGCGTGILFDFLRRRVSESGIVIGIDFSTRMSKRAHRNFPFENCLPLNADAHNLPLKSDIFDLAISFAAFAHFTEHGKVIDEVARILKKNGRFHIIHLLGSQELARHHHYAGGPVALDHLPSRENMTKLFEDSRFGDIQIIDRPGLYHASGVRR
jgi:demethylmenaquinone methyltransferase/2-methoxy-6-polyprenyl-1,4-benzoquinol methylase